MKDGLASKERNIEKLKDEISKVVQEKEKEVKSALESMTKLEAEVSSEKKKVEVAELKLASSMEEHRYIHCIYTVYRVYCTVYTVMYTVHINRENIIQY